MPKPQAKNAFFFYMLKFKRDQENRGVRFPNGIKDAAEKASPSWSKMTAQEKGPYVAMAKDAKVGSTGNGGERYTTLGVSFSEREKQQKAVADAEARMTKEVAELIHSSYLNNSMIDQYYYFIAGNYFCKTSQYDFIPAELAILKFCLKDGKVGAYHTYVNPGKLPTGYAYEAKSHSEEHHRLPIPPMAKGQRDYGVILREITDFIGKDSGGKYPPLFTDAKLVDEVRSYITQFCQDTGDDPEQFRVYPLVQLFFMLKGEACQYGMDETAVGFPSIHIAQDFIDRDPYDMYIEFACDFHADDTSKRCALSCVHRWSCILCDHICADVDVQLVPGKHAPLNADVSIASELKRDLDDSKSFLKLKAEEDYDEFNSSRQLAAASTSFSSASTTMNYNSSVGTSRGGGGAGASSDGGSQPFNNPWKIPKQEDNTNPWSIRDSHKPRKPKDSALKFQYNNN